MKTAGPVKYDSYSLLENSVGHPDFDEFLLLIRPQMRQEANVSKRCGDCPSASDAARDAVLKKKKRDPLY